MRQFFIDPSMLQGDTAYVSGDVHHHLARVLRMTTGTVIQLVFLNGERLTGTIRTISRDLTEVTITQRHPAVHQRACRIHLIQGLPKADHLAMILQKGTELGLAQITLVPTSTSVMKISAEALPERMTRWERICKEAARQSERDTIPKLTWLQNLVSLPTQTDTSVVRLFLWERGEDTRPVREQLEDFAPPQEVQVLVGPEGGFSPGEYQQITKAGFIPLHLGSRIMRTETASLAITTILQYSWGDL